MHGVMQPSGPMPREILHSMFGANRCKPFEIGNFHHRCWGLQGAIGPLATPTWQPQFSSPGSPFQLQVCQTRPLSCKTVQTIDSVPKSGEYDSRTSNKSLKSWYVISS